MSIAAIDPTKPVDGVPAVKADLRANLAAIKGALEAGIQGVPSVKDFGAVGDDTADDTAAFQAALNSFPDAGGVLLVPPGVYKITDTIAWPRRSDFGTFGKPIVITSLAAFGEGWFLGPVKLHYTPTTGTCLDIRNGTRNSESDPQWLGAIHGICFEGSGGTDIGILANRIIDGALENIQFKNWGTGLQVQGGYWKTPLRQLQFENAPVVFDPGVGSSGSGALSNGALFDTCVFKNSPTHGLILGENGNGATVRGVKFHNCNFENNAGYGVRLWSRTGAASIHNSTNAIFDKCYVEGNGSGFIDFIVDTKLEHWSRLEVLNSHIALDDGTPVVNWRGVTALSKTLISSRGNHFEDANGAASYIVRRDAATIAGLYPRLAFAQNVTQFLPSMMRLYSGDIDTETDGYTIIEDAVAEASGFNRSSTGRPVLRNFAESVQTPSIVSGALAFNFVNGNVGEVTLTANVTSMAFQNAPQSGLAGTLTLILRQDGTGGRTVAWPASVTWLDAAPSMPAAAGAALVVAFLTTDGGASWLGFKGGST